MSRLTLLVGLILVSTAPLAEAQPLKVASAGDKAVLFNFTGLSTVNLGAYQGGIGGKYFLSDGVALRGMFLFGMDNKTTKGAAGFTDETDNTMSFGIGGGLEYHLPLASRVSPYFGGQLSVSTSSETYTPSVFTGGTASSVKSTSTSFGFGAIAGVEYFFNQNISLAAEYQLGVAFNSFSNPNSSELKLGFQTAGLTFAVYF